MHCTCATVITPGQNVDEAPSGPDFWEAGIAMHERMVQWCDETLAKGITSGEWFPGESLRDVRRRHAANAERCRRVLRAMKGES